MARLKTSQHQRELQRREKTQLTSYVRAARRTRKPKLKNFIPDGIVMETIASFSIPASATVQESVSILRSSTVVRWNWFVFSAKMRDILFLRWPISSSVWVYKRAVVLPCLTRMYSDDCMVNTKTVSFCDVKFIWSVKKLPTRRTIPSCVDVSLSKLGNRTRFEYNTWENLCCKLTAARNAPEWFRAPRRSSANDLACPSNYVFASLWRRKSLNFGRGDSISSLATLRSYFPVFNIPIIVEIIFAECACNK